jgi:predicted nucleic acid-binding protein
MTTYLLDTDHVIGLIGSEKPIIDRLKRSVKAGDRFSICVTTLSELYCFAKSTAQMDLNTAALTELVAELPVWEMDRGASEIVGEILIEQRTTDRPIPRAVAEVSAIARQRQLVVLSSDPSFRVIRDITVEDWRAAERG